METVLLQELSSLRRTLLEGELNSARLVPLLSPRPLPDGRVAQRRQYLGLELVGRRTGAKGHQPIM